MFGHFSRVVCRVSPSVPSVLKGYTALSVPRSALPSTTPLDHPRDSLKAAPSAVPVATTTPQSAAVWELCGGDAALYAWIDSAFHMSVEPALRHHGLTLDEFATQPLVSRRLLLLDALAYSGKKQPHALSQEEGKQCALQAEAVDAVSELLPGDRLQLLLMRSHTIRRSGMLCTL